MLRISVNFSKKVPGSAEYSSDGFMCALEMEAADSTVNDPNELRKLTSWLWSEAKKSVEEQIAQKGDSRIAPTTARPHKRPNGDQPATPKQIRYVISLGQRNHGMTMADLRSYLKRTVGVEDPSELTRATASSAIDGLSNGGGR